MVINYIRKRSTTIENTLYGERPIMEVSRVHPSGWKREESYSGNRK